jgi:hypothetical protein
MYFFIWASRDRQSGEKKLKFYQGMEMAQPRILEHVSPLLYILTINFREKIFLIWWAIWGLRKFLEHGPSRFPSLSCSFILFLIYWIYCDTIFSFTMFHFAFFLHRSFWKMKNICRSWLDCDNQIVK